MALPPPGHPHHDPVAWAKQQEAEREAAAVRENPRRRYQRQPEPQNAFGIFDYSMLPKLNKLLKPFGLEFKKRSNRKEWGDQVEIAIAPLPEALTALEVISRYGGIDGGHHKQWVLDQVVRALTGNGYAAWVEKQKDGEDGPNTYDWDEGIAP